MSSFTPFPFFPTALLTFPFHALYSVRALPFPFQYFFSSFITSPFLHVFFLPFFLCLFALLNPFPFVFLLFRPSLPFNQLSVVPISSHLSPISPPPFTFSFFVSAPFSSSKAVGVSPVCCRYCSCSAFHSFQIGQRRR